jgi:polyisoprenoid-binding protein YceI
MNRLPVAAALLLPLLFTAAVPDTVQRFEIDRNHSRVGFAVRHMGVATVRGEFRDFEGHVLLDTADITQSTAHVVIRTATIDTGNERRDNHLRSDDFFNAERFPTITFEGRHVEQTPDGYALVGDLTIRDVTKEVRIPFELNGPLTLDGRQRLGAEGEVLINRKEFNLLWNNMVEGISVVSDDVRIELAIEAATPRPQS